MKPSRIERAEIALDGIPRTRADAEALGFGPDTGKRRVLARRTYSLREAANGDWLVDETDLQGNVRPVGGCREYVHAQLWLSRIEQAITTFTLDNSLEGDSNAQSRS